MQTSRRLSAFLDSIQNDPHIGSTHISLFVVLLEASSNVGFQNPLLFSRKEIIQRAKIRSRETRNKCLKDLQAGGYILYEPSHIPGESRIYIL